MKFKLIFFSLFLAVSLSARKADDGEALFNSKQYAKARPVYEALLKQKPNDALYNYRYARCCYELKDAENAIKHFEMSGSKFPMRDLYLGELYYNTYKFDESVMAYQTYMATLKPDDSKIPEYQRKAKLAENAARLLTKVDDIAIVDSQVVNKSDFLRSYKFSSELGSLKQEQIKIPGRKSVDKITYTTQRQDRVYYSDSIHGQLNVFTSYKLFDAWSEPVSISDVINTTANENYPFLLLDGVTVYFASDGENSIGGYDLFVTRFTPSTNTYLAPENIGFPFNSPANDYMMVIDEQRKLGWFATDRNQASGKVMIYTFVPNEVRNTVRSEDKDYIRSVARLKVYRKAAQVDTENQLVGQSQDAAAEKQFEFVVNDSVVYTQTDEFKSEGGAKLWIEVHTLSAVHKKAKAELSEKRTQYMNSENEADKNDLAKAILDMEKKNLDMERLISVKTIQLRNLENSALLGRKADKN
ncbi:MAG: tetratricopeptide repeat protein [Paludibacter sp.]